MEPFWAEAFANPSSPYTFARAASRAVAVAREQVASLVGAAPGRVVFTSGGTESNHMAVHAAFALRPDRRTFVGSAVEHPALLATVRQAESSGRRVVYLPVAADGALDLTELERAVNRDTALVSVMAANNETGVLFPLEAVRAVAHRAGALFHTDAAQAAGKVPLSIDAADMVSLCSHKFYGPKGIGCLVVGEDAAFPPLMGGGGQEGGHRAGTENVPAIVGMGAAAIAARDRVAAEGPRLEALRDRLEAGVTGALPGVVVAGAGQPRLPNTSMLLIPGVDADILIARLDMEGFCCSPGSACAAGAHEPSHVLRAMGVGRGVGTVRISLGLGSTLAHVESLVERLRAIVLECRALR